MKRICLEHIKNPDTQSHLIKDRKYCVYLGNGRFRYFNNGHRAKTYLVEINRQLTVSLFELNDLFAVIFWEYRQFWILITDLDFEAEINNTIREINRLFELAVYRQKFVNGTAFLYKHFNNICNTFTELIDKFIKHYLERQCYRDIHRLEGVKRRITNVQNTVNSIGNEIPDTAYTGN